jgi:uncharacterized membrane protein
VFSVTEAPERVRTAGQRGLRAARAGMSGGFRGLRSMSFYQVLFYGYLAISLTAFIFLVPPFQKSDEPAHFWRTVSITNLQFACQRGEEGDYFFTMKRKWGNLDVVMRTWDVAFDSSLKFRREWLRADFSDPAFQEEVRIHRFCSLPVPGYLPNAAGLLLGKPFENPLIGFYLSRTFGALFFVAAVALSLRIAPENYRMLIYFYAALPTVLHQVSAVSYDVVQLSLFPLILAYMTRFATDRDLVKPGHLLVFMGLLLWTVNVRLFAYYPLVLLYFLVRPWQVAPRVLSYLAVTAGFFLAVALTTGLAMLVYLPMAEDSTPENVNINAREQVRLVLTEPLTFVQASYSTLRVWGEGLMRETIGVFGWIDYTFIYVPYYVAVALAGIVLYYTASRDSPLFRPGQLAVLFGALSMTVGLLFLSLYAVWTPVGFDIVHGLQGRYFVGLMPFAVLLISQTAALVGKERFLKLTVALLAFFFAYSIIHAIISRYGWE